MYKIVRQGEGVYPLDYNKAETVREFSVLRKALNYWKKQGLNRKRHGYFLILTVEGVAPVTLRLERKHFC